MAQKLDSFTPQQAWQPLPTSEWNETAARHLLQRIGFAAPPEVLARTLQDGAAATLERYFAAMPAFPKPSRVAKLQAETGAMVAKLKDLPPAEKRAAAKEAREQSRDALQEMILSWLRLASTPANSPAEKWLLFLSDVWVVSVEKVKNTALIFEHQEILRQHALGTAPALAKAVTRSPAMVVYLDLQQSKREAPNENFARELFELFTLGEGNYSEADIKEAARAFTGYRQREGEFLFVRRQHDPSTKNVFGQRGAYDGDGIVDLVFKRPAAATFLPKEMSRFYLTDRPLPEAHLQELGTIWARTGFDLRKLATTFFGSRAFFAEEFRGDFIKSPVQFYLGLIQDLDLQVAPLPRYVLTALKQMGQMPFDPPNVRGWVGGKSWINSATLAVRRQVINGLLQPLNPKLLNADEQGALNRAGPLRYNVEPAQLEAWAKLSSTETADRLIKLALPTFQRSELRNQLEAFLNEGPDRAVTVRTALATLLESPAYQLC